MIFGWFLCDCKPPGTPNPHAVLPHLLFIFLRSKSERSLVNYPPEILCWCPRMYQARSYDVRFAKDSESLKIENE